MSPRRIPPSGPEMEVWLGEPENRRHYAMAIFVIGRLRPALISVGSLKLETCTDAERWAAITAFKART